MAQRGAALVVAMLVFALVAALMVGLQRDFTLTLQRGTHQLFSEQAWAYLLGAEGKINILGSFPFPFLASGLRGSLTVLSRGFPSAMPTLVPVRIVGGPALPASPLRV